MGNSLSHPVRSKSLLRKGDERARIGAGSMHGWRDSMEDAHEIVLSLPSHPTIAYFGVYDGHTGASAAQFMARQLHGRIDALADPTNHEQLTAVVEQADLDFMSDERVRSEGCTACVALVKTSEDGTRTLTVAAVGDTRCLVITAGGSVKFTTVDHKPDTLAERERIEAAGGTIEWGTSLHGRVDGLNMSRAMGDWGSKRQADRGQREQKLIPTPDCTDIVLAPTDVVLVCCDGLVEQLSNEQVSSFIAQQLEKQRAPTESGEAGEVDPAAVMQALLEYSLEANSQDNMSCTLYIPIDGTTYSAAEEYALGPIAPDSRDRFIEVYLKDAELHGLTPAEVLERLGKSPEDAPSAERLTKYIKGERVTSNNFDINELLQGKLRM